MRTRTALAFLEHIPISAERTMLQTSRGAAPSSGLPSTRDSGGRNAPSRERRPCLLNGLAADKLRLLGSLRLALAVRRGGARDAARTDPTG